MCNELLNYNFTCSLLMCLQAGQGALSMAAALQDFQRTESDRLNEVKGHLEIALLEKHFLREYLRTPPSSLRTPAPGYVADVPGNAVLHQLEMVRQIECCRTV